MGTNCTSIVANLLLLYYTSISLSEENQADITEAFMLTFKYPDDLLHIANIYFEQITDHIYPVEILLNKLILLIAK